MQPILLILSVFGDNFASLAFILSLSGVCDLLENWVYNRSPCKGVWVLHMRQAFGPRFYGSHRLLLGTYSRSKRVEIKQNMTVRALS